MAKFDDSIVKSFFYYNSVKSTKCIIRKYFLYLTFYVLFHNLVKGHQIFLQDTHRIQNLNKFCNIT